MSEQEIHTITRSLQMSNRELALKLGKTEAQIRNFLFREHIRRTPEQLEQIRLRIGANQVQEKNPNWKNGRSTNHYYYKKRMVEKYPLKNLARARVYYHKRQGNIIPGTCEECGTKFSIEAHHPDYEEGLNIIWLCTVCHRELHKKEREQAGRVNKPFQIRNKKTIN